ncbi:MAG TPA: hypothetical protein VEW95_11110 [Candidatus Limnocylindrales bacterium]|nr:hypothetical protein [Candidatus Limnocylindrales bacterium]
MSVRSPRRSRTPALRLETPELDAVIAAAERGAIVVWRGERISFADLPSLIARTDGRVEREGLYAGWIDALEALNPLYQERHAALRERAAAGGADDLAAAVAVGVDIEALALELERLAIQSETVYHAALRRYLALIGIEQGDATIADLWHVERGASWSQWFGERDLNRAAAEAGRNASGTVHGEGWRSGESGLAGTEPTDGPPAAAVAELYGSLVGDPVWLRRALRMAPNDLSSFADFVAFVRLRRLRRLLSLVQYEMRLYRTDDESMQRAYYSGIVGHMIGVNVPEAAYLHDGGAPFSSVADLRRTLLAGAMAELLESRFGTEWWANDEARALTATLAGASTADDALAQTGYDALDWRPVLRQIRTRLIGEMSGYGGPNITTRAGTRKV